jgi:polyisoprenoid-binding protein YceI
MKKQLIALTISLTALTSTFAATVDTSTSNFKWTATKKVGDAHYGPIPVKSHKLETDEQGNLKGGEFVMDLTKVDVTDLQGEWKDKFLGHIKNADFFDVEKYPTAKLVLTSLTDGKAKGKLTIKEKTQDVEFNVKNTGNTYEGKLVFDRTKFDIVYGSGNFFKELTADKIINNDVTVDFKVVVQK